MFVTNWISPTKIQKISEITNFFRHYFLSRTEVNIVLSNLRLLVLLKLGLVWLIRYIQSKYKLVKLAKRL